MNIHAFRCRNRNVFDYGVLTQTLPGMLNNMRYMCRINFLKSEKFWIPKHTPIVSAKRLWTCIINVFFQCLHNTGCRVSLYCSNYSWCRAHVNTYATMRCRLLGLAFVLTVKRKFLEPHFNWQQTSFQRSAYVIKIFFVFVFYCGFMCSSVCVGRVQEVHVGIHVNSVFMLVRFYPELTGSTIPSNMFHCRIQWRCVHRVSSYVRTDGPMEGRTERFNIRSTGMWTRLKTLEVKEMCAILNSFGTFVLLLLLDFQLTNTFFFYCSVYLSWQRCVVRL